MIRLNFNPEFSGASNTANIRAVVWTGPGLPAAGVVTHRSQRCATSDRFPITNQEGLLTVNNSSTIQFWNNGGGVDFIVDGADLDGSALALPTPSTNWATNPTPVSQDVRSAAFTGTVEAWSLYKAEIYYFTNTGATPDEVIYVRNGTPYERAAAGATRNWPQLSATFIDGYLKPVGANAGSLTSLAQTMSWTNSVDSYVNFGYLFSQNRSGVERCHRGDLDLDLGPVLDQRAPPAPPSSPRRSCRSRRGRSAPISRASRQVLALVGHVPGHAHDVLGLGAGLGQHRHHVVQRLAHLAGQVVGVELALPVPADHAGDEDLAAAHGHAVGIALGARPAGRLQYLCHGSGLGSEAFDRAAQVGGDVDGAVRVQTGEDQHLAHAHALLVAAAAADAAA